MEKELDFEPKENRLSDEQAAEFDELWDKFIKEQKQEETNG